MFTLSGTRIKKILFILLFLHFWSFPNFILTSYKYNFWTKGFKLHETWKNITCQWCFLTIARYTSKCLRTLFASSSPDPGGCKHAAHVATYRTSLTRFSDLRTRCSCGTIPQSLSRSSGLRTRCSCGTYRTSLTRSSELRTRCSFIASHDIRNNNTFDNYLYI